jgi:hypothetical protein
MCVGLTVGQGVPPATLAEWTLQGDSNRDFYDVSLVDGYNIPMRIDNTAGCPVYVASFRRVSFRPTSRAAPTASSTSARTARLHCRVRSTPRAIHWDASRRAKSTRTRRTAQTAAAAPTTPRRPVLPRMSSTTAISVRLELCNLSLALMRRTESSCPNAYAYAYDESSGSALWTCDSTLAADYILTFCP